MQNYGYILGVRHHMPPSQPVDNSRKTVDNPLYLGRTVDNSFASRFQAPLYMGGGFRHPPSVKKACGMGKTALFVLCSPQVFLWRKSGLVYPRGRKFQRTPPTSLAAQSRREDFSTYPQPLLRLLYIYISHEKVIYYHSSNSRADKQARTQVPGIAQNPA